MNHFHHSSHCSNSGTRSYPSAEYRHRVLGAASASRSKSGNTIRRNAISETHG